MDRSRWFLGENTVGPFHTHDFVLRGRGSATQLHQHAHPHMIRADKPIGVYAVTADGFEKVEKIGVWDKRLVRAHIPHIVFSLEDGETTCECEFSLYDENGPIGDPKAESTKPYVETCNTDLLPELVKRFLAECANS